MITKQILYISLVSLLGLQLAEPKSSNTQTNEDYLENHDLCLMKTKYAAMAPSARDSTFAPSLQLLKMTLFALQDMTLTYARKAKTASELMLKDRNLKENHSVEVQDFKQKIQQFEENYSSCSELEGLFEMVEYFSNVTSEYYEREQNKTLADDSAVILNVLKNNGCQEIKDEFEKTFNTFVNVFAKKYAELKVDLQEEKGEVGVRVVDWWGKAKSLQTHDEKMEAFAKYIKLHH